MNLITNASEALGDEAGIVTLSTGHIDVDDKYLSEVFLKEEIAPGRYAYLEVSDTGCGMDKETQEKIFDPFFSTKFTGRGLGLSAVMGIVRGHKGVIKVYSEPGKGTSFKLLFPSSHKAATQPGKRPPSRAEEWCGSGTILVIDDEEVIRNVLKHSLERHGFSIQLANDGASALQFFEQRSKDVVAVIMDMTMPGMSGEETFRELRRVRPDVRVLLTSGYNEQDATNRFAGKGLAGFIQKPFRISALTQKLRDIVAS
jgi:CheY-like chemotaxis protein